MASKPGRAIGGALLGGLVGAGMGLWLGPVLAGVKPDNHSIFGLLDACAGLFFGVVGGVIGTILGAVLGAALATAPSVEQRPHGQADTQQVPESGLAAPQEPTEAEVARLKAAFAELDERQRRDSTADPRGDSMVTEITSQQGTISATTGISRRIEPNKAEQSPADVTRNVEPPSG